MATEHYKSQAGEDKFLYENFFKDKKNGKYIELGAMSGLEYSNTYFFEKEMSWSGILIEPNIFNFELLKQNRPDNYLFNNLISNNSEQVCFRYFKDACSGVSGIEKTLPKRHFETFFDTDIFCQEKIHNSSNDKCICWYKTQLIQGRCNMTPKSLTEIIKSTDIKEFDFLSLDVEGHEYEVLESWDFSIPINVILIEMLGLDKEREEMCRKKLIQNNYSFYCQYSQNEVYILNK